MSRFDLLGKILVKEVTNFAKSTARSQVKKRVTKLFKGLMAPSPEEIAQKVRSKIGFDTIHFRMEKDILVFKNSPALVMEWIEHSSITQDKVVRDEETGRLFFDGAKMDNGKIRELFNEYLKATEIKSTVSAYSSFERVLKNLDPQDITARTFKNDFSGGQGSAMIDGWLSGAFGEAISTDMEYANRLFKKWIVGTARRTIDPGASLDGCLTLQGPPGVGKTRFFREILPPPYDLRAGEIYCKDIKNPQKFVEAIVGKTVACFDELSVLQDSGVEDSFKQLLSSQNIDVRLAWAREPRRYALRQGFSATSNPEKFIRDPALNRRLWVIQLNDKRRLDFGFVRANREALWKEAVALAQTDFSVHLDYDEQKEVETFNTRFAI